jgi:hypothetical protein
VEWEVQERPDLFADCAKVLQFNIVEVELIDKVLKIVNGSFVLFVLLFHLVNRLTIAKTAAMSVPIAPRLKLKSSDSIAVMLLVRPITPSPSYLTVSVWYSSQHSAVMNSQ